MKLPNGENAVVPDEKLLEYCLSPDHPDGRHKARVFHSALGIDRSNASILRASLLEAARVAEAAPGATDGFGQRFVIDFSLTTAIGSALVRSAWVVPPEANASPRLVSCYVI